ncbi:MAG: hypothetical protein P8M73_04270 [Luminiphilus sp.]|nr:hypothetical protein [Luminiphilus sp.]
MAYLIFIVAVGLYALLGAGGPLHRDAWFEALNQRVDALELELLPSLALRVGAPLFACGMLLFVLRAVMGGLADALIGTALLYFALGRGDYPTDLARFLARARVGDTEGAALLLDDFQPEASASEGQRTRAMTQFTGRGFSRWFPPVFYFWLLGPLAAAGYRLFGLVNIRADGRLDSVQVILDWLPARLSLLTFALLGDFERTRGLLTADAFDKEVSNQVLLARGVTRAWQLESGDCDEPEDVVEAVEASRTAINRAMAVWVVLASLGALF